MPANSRKWKVREPDPALVEKFCSELGLSPIVARVLANRGIGTPEKARAFLEAGLPSLHDPFLLPGMAAAVQRIQQAIAAREKILVYGDYDVDGITSTYLLLTVLRRLGAEADYYIPNRLEEGYGVNREALARASAGGFQLVATVDCGITAVEEAAYAAGLGMEVIITDHHQPPAVLPEAAAVVNPHLRDSSYPSPGLAGVGVAFKLSQALLGDGALDFLDIVCLGTIADVVPLAGENRIIVKYGLPALGRTENPGLRALLQVTGLQGKELATGHVGFALAPRINAAGRLGDPRLGVRLLASATDAEALELARLLDGENRARQTLEERIKEEALAKLEEQVDLASQKVIVLAGEGWHSGVIGIVASKITEAYNRPSILLTVEGDQAHGSGRSAPGFDLYAALAGCGGLLEKFGGHAQAAGLALKAGQIDAFRKQINLVADRLISWEDLQPELVIDALVDLPEATGDLAEQLALLAPYGPENPAPVLAASGVLPSESRVVGSGGAHLKLRARDQHTGMEIDGIGFNMAGYTELLSNHFGAVDLAFTLELNEWNGKKLPQLVLKDLKLNEAGLSRIDALFREAVGGRAEDPYKDILDADEFYTKLAGVTFGGRQEEIRRISPAQPLFLIREPENIYDPNAVKVLEPGGATIGYLKADLARHLAAVMDRGMDYQARVALVTGGGDRAYGLNIFIQREVSVEEMIEHQATRQRRGELSRLGDEAVREAIRQCLLGEHPYRPKQLEAIEALLAGENTLAILGTGRGKSAIFQTVAAWKALRERMATLIIYPLRALVNDQYEAMRRRLKPLGIRVYKATGSLRAREREDLAAALAAGEADIILATPEFAEAHLVGHPDLTGRLGFFVVDESHHIGRVNSSRGAYQRLDRLSARLGHPLILAVTATAGREAAGEINQMLRITRVVVDPSVRRNLSIVDGRSTSERRKLDVLRKIVASGEKAIIYVNSREQSIELARLLRRENLDRKDEIAFYHAGLDNGQRVMLEDLFRSGAVKVIVATSAFGEGIDVPDIRDVVHYHLTFNSTDFNQQSGRAGRDDHPARIHLLFNERDVELNRRILTARAPDRAALRRIYLALRDLAGPKAGREDPVENGSGVGVEVVVGATCATNQEIADAANSLGAAADPGAAG
ncbi:MAG: single-stranded-DNA-specific exonuclease RecJ, partial [Firmicutes bacterium]|nr:single-stranded-DNA-specific exonuclease RecJ [Bacillota bacterium]